MRLERLTLYYLVTPLTRPYVLSFGSVREFHSFVALAEWEDGVCRVGESTPLPGYSHETAELLCREYQGLQHQRDFGAFLERNKSNPFVLAPLWTSLDFSLRLDHAGEVPLCPILQGRALEDFTPTIAKLARQGNRVIKVKLDGDLTSNQWIIARTIAAGERYGVRFRYDANQALDLPTARKLARSLHHPSTELLEQPFAVSAWEDMKELHAECPVPLMLDESIVDANSVERAASCANYVKLKLAKNVCPAQVMDLIRRAHTLGLQVILGNGVQGPIGCWLEGLLFLEAGLSHAGEMNGYRKLRDRSLPGLFQDTATGFSTLQPVPWRQLRDYLRSHSNIVWQYDGLDLDGVEFSEFTWGKHSCLPSCAPSGQTGMFAPRC
ncbi:MAG: hypothetical protein L0215_23960 [Gemmataceae bacterium]|nr:hypothetical protein [Gemmataceae bacterium]